MVGTFGKRILLFLVTNLAVVVLLGIVLRLVGIESLLQAEGIRLDYRSLLILAAVIGFAGSFISLAFSKTIAKFATGAQVIDQPTTQVEAWLYQTVRRLAGQAGIGMPEVAIFPADEPNAFATGARRNHALVAVSAGLLHSMDRREVEAVLAHEVAHVANGDMITMALLQGVLNTFVVFLSRIAGHVVDRAVFRTERGHGPGFWIVTIVAELLLGVFATVIAMWFSRRREFRADAGAAQLTSPGDMISALRALQADRGPSRLPDSLAAFGIRGRPSGRWAQLFMSHPPIEERIRALQGN